MKLLLSTCYGRISKLPKGTPLVRTSHGAPDFLSKLNHTFEAGLTPKGFKQPNWRELYQQQMERMFADGSLQKIVARLPNGAALLCFEADHCDCHRRILAEFLTSHKLANVTEYSVQPAPKAVTPVNPQLSLL